MKIGFFSGIPFTLCAAMSRTLFSTMKDKKPATQDLSKAAKRMVIE
jgi:hypothetical protein